ncbi:hypothetical protein N7481_009573 [Penicillium waksmanii]|uniref:uncharacterized protein n=1 Tax=Penicillium waksmanii TaxID=69791 RepID=UPI0025466C00|nr:uncharacterized protein N7481_009573 [Penicillium waksmanii]KAJ5975866.1 hypothetical protein N7481_009573 [Penicillium waksmanii]
MASEAMEDVQPGEKRPALDIESLKRKKFKAEDLPLSAAQHAAIDKLLHSFKKKGGFDSIRKQLWADFNEGESKSMFTDQLIALAESEIEREPAHLSRERGKAATLIEGAVDRGDVYKNVEDSIDRLASKHLDAIMDTVRAIRRQEIGEDAAAKEEQAGCKTDDAYDAHVKEKRDAREEVYREEMRKQKEIEDEQKRIRAEELRKKREIERKKEDEERARRKEIDDQRRAERERLRDEQRALDEQRDRERDERWRAPPVDEKSLEEAALQMLLKEGEELAAKARQKPEFDFEEAEAIENGLKPGSQCRIEPGIRTGGEVEAAAVLIADMHLIMTRTAVETGLGMLQLDRATVTWTSVLDSATFANALMMSEAGGQRVAAAVVADLLAGDGTGIVNVSEIVPAQDLVNVIMTAGGMIAAETEVGIVTVMSLAAALAPRLIDAHVVVDHVPAFEKLGIVSE